MPVTDDAVQRRHPHGTISDIQSAERWAGSEHARFRFALRACVGRTYKLPLIWNSFSVGVRHLGGICMHLHSLKHWEANSIERSDCIRSLSDRSLSTIYHTTQIISNLAYPSRLALQRMLPRTYIPSVPTHPQSQPHLLPKSPPKRRALTPLRHLRHRDQKVLSLTALILQIPHISLRDLDPRRPLPPARTLTLPDPHHAPRVVQEHIVAVEVARTDALALLDDVEGE